MSESATVNFHSKKVCIILAYYNGLEFIDEQLQSILSQTHKNIHVFISDDCSDKPLQMSDLSLTDMQKQKITISRNNHNLGFAANFMKRLESLPLEFDYYAFSDQDDLWCDKKVERAINLLELYKIVGPKLYCSRTEIVCAKGQVHMGYSPLFQKKPSFNNALVQNIGGGNTMLFNKLAKDKIISFWENRQLVAHDWFVYQVVTGIGGHVVYDATPNLRYRQHQTNIIGSNNSFFAKLTRLSALLRGDYKRWNQINLNLLLANVDLLTEKNAKAVLEFDRALKSTLIKRLYIVARLYVYRQTFFGNVGLWLGLLLGKV